MEVADQCNVATATSLGGRIESFSPSPVTLIAGFIVGSMVTTGGAVFVWVTVRDVILSGGNLPLAAEKGSSWSSVMLGGMVIGLYGTGAFFLLRHIVRLARHRVEFCENGFRYRTLDTLDEVAWTDLAAIRQTISLGWLSEEKCIRIEIVTKSGKKYAFDKDSVNNLTRIGALLFEQTGSTGIPRETIGP